MRRLILPRKSTLAIVALLTGMLFLPPSPSADPSKYPQFAQQAPPDNVAFISVDELVEEIKTGVKPIIIDVRTGEEFREGHILGAVSAPLDRFNGYLQNIPKDRLVILY